MILAETTIRGETFTYRALWDCCLAQVEAAEKTNGGKQAFYMTSMLMAYLTFESYINFLGDRFTPDIWKRERKFFSQKEYWGLSGKLKYLSEKIPIEGMKTDRRPFQTIGRLKKLRDFLAHGPVDRYEKTIVHRRDKEPPLFGYGKIDRCAAPALAAKAVKDVKEAIEFLHAQACKHTEDMWFGKDPWDDFRAHASSDSRTKA
jgi:hypothetical protein